RIIRSHPRFFKMTQLYGKKGTGSSTFLKNCTFFLKMDFFSGLRGAMGVSLDRIIIFTRLPIHPS
ncbi:hypothetical protein, partial [Paenibacillus periandrae]|uniref:hypothetical protein n=1 Tax=Paenibacillus periandrae TaxID=1761741 RepID=UPI001F08C82F